MNNKKLGRLNRQRGAIWELKVRGGLIEKDWLVIKNPNNVIDEKFKQGKSRYNPFTKQLMMNSGGFPDFICWRKSEQEVIGVECKVNGYLDQKERAKCEWLLKNKIFNKILIAKKIKEKGKIKIEYKTLTK